MKPGSLVRLSFLSLFVPFALLALGACGASSAPEDLAVLESVASPLQGLEIFSPNRRGRTMGDSNAFGRSPTFSR